MANTAMVVDARLEDDLADGAADPYDYGDDDVVNYEDPYLQGLLAPADYD